VRGTGRSRRAAEQSAAKQAFEAAQRAISHLGRRPRKKHATAEAASETRADTKPEIKTPADDKAQTVDQA
jgi:hypothetical protein